MVPARLPDFREPAAVSIGNRIAATAGSVSEPFSKTSGGTLCAGPSGSGDNGRSSRGCSWGRSRDFCASGREVGPVRSAVTNRRRQGSAIWILYGGQRGKLRVNRVGFRPRGQQRNWRDPPAFQSWRSSQGDFQAELLSILLDERDGIHGGYAGNPECSLEVRAASVIQVLVRKSGRAIFS